MLVGIIVPVSATKFMQLYFINYLITYLIYLFNSIIGLKKLRAACREIG